MVRTSVRTQVECLAWSPILKGGGKRGLYKWEWSTNSRFSERGQIGLGGGMANRKAERLNRGEESFRGGAAP